MENALIRPHVLFAPNRATAVRGRRLSLQLLVGSFVGDTVVAFLALAASAWLRFESPLADLGVDARLVDWLTYRGHVLLGTALFAILALHFRVYTVPAMLRYRLYFEKLLKVAAVWVVAYSSLAYLLRFDQPVSRLYVLIALILTTGSLLAWRRAFHRTAARAAVWGKLRQRVLFVDWSPHSAALAETMTVDRQHLFEIAGCVASADDHFTAEPPRRVRRLGAYDRLPALLEQGAVDMVILADLKPSDEEMLRLANLCEKEMVEFKVIPSCFQVFVSGLHLESVNGVPVLGISHLPLDSPFNVAVKQVVDFIGGLVGLVLSAPLIAVCCLLVYLESPGPVFYRQKRLGRDGRPFWLYKIRSMALDAEAPGQVGWSKRDDPRRLRVGGFLRRWNIDETPQFWNVVRGDMSLVGPRPERPELIVNFKEAIPHYNARHNIKPGMTGWAQINGFRGDTDLTERIRCDLFYIENWNVLLDLQIMLLTLFKHKNAC
jgi:exopolysaccharide biosynthesis polyprenyl glycosylphosphotransferase